MALVHHYHRTHRFPPGYPKTLDLATSFWMAAHWVWERREVAKRAGMPFSEETITDTVLLDLATHHPKELKVIPFNKHKEGKTGADWEWCFYDQARSTYLPMLVQAKLLDDNEKKYSHINRTIGSTGVRQIDRLLETSRKRRVPAIFAFYNHLSDTGRIPNVCGSYCCHECWGCSVALAGAVRATKSTEFDALKAHSKPWVCLLCRGMPPRQDLPSRVLATLHDLFARSERQFEDTDTSIANEVSIPETPHQGAPQYFSRLIELEYIENPVERDELVGQIANENPGVDGIVLVTDGPESHG